jgi:phage shock protein C
VTERLYRSTDDRMLAGVAGGLAEMLDIDPSLVRVIWAVLIVLTGGLFLLVYIVMAIVVPERPDGVQARPPAGSAAAGAAGGGQSVTTTSGSGQSPRRRTDRSDATRGGFVAGLVLIVIGTFFLVRQLIPSIDLGYWWPVLAIGLGILLVILSLVPTRRSG